MAPPAAAQQRQPALAFAYVGTVDRGSERFAVLARDQSVLVVRAGETINGQYRVHSIGERLRLVELASGVVHELALARPSSPGAPAAQQPAVEIPANAPPAEGDRPKYEH